MISCHPSILHILILILNTATFSYGLQYPTVYLLCGATSWLLGILPLSNYIVHCISPVDIPADVSNYTLVAIVTVWTEIWISEHPPSSHLQPKLTINQWLLLVILRYLHASPYIIYRFPMATIVVVCLFSYIDCCIRNTPMVDCYIRCHNIFHIFQYTSVDCCVYIAKFLCCKRSFCKKTFVDWVSIDAPWLIVVFVCILHTLIVNCHHILYTKMPPLLCIINPNMLFIPSCTIMYS